MTTVPVKKLTITRTPLDKLGLEALANLSSDFSWRPTFLSASRELGQIETVLRKVQAEYTGSALPVDAWLFAPRRQNLFRVFKETVLSQVKVLIIGMDPYPGFYEDGTPIACGIAFSAERTIPRSLDNIFAELKRSIPGFIKPTTGDLRPWCKQGVMLLNASLTHLPNGDGKTQKDVWLPFVYKVLEAITTTRKNLAICMWGRDAQSYEKYINGSHLLLQCSHPSPMSATKGPEPFIGSDHFVKINEYLVAHQREPINWALV